MLVSRMLLPALLAGPLLGQAIELTAKPAEGPRRIAIDASIATENERKILVDGEEPDFGGRGGFGSGPASAKHKIVLDEGPAGSGWRVYRTLEATSSSPGRDGNSREASFTGVLVGKKVKLSRDEDGRTVLSPESTEGDQSLPEGLGRGVALEIDLGQWLPGKAIAVDGEFELGAGFRKSIAGLFHPVTAARAEREPDAARGERRRGDRGLRGGNRGSTFGDAFELLFGDALDTTGKAKLVEVVERDGVRCAKIELAAKMSGAGDAEELGIESRFGRRGFGPGGDNASTIVEVEIEVTGTAWVDVAAGQVAELKLAGTVAYRSDTQGTSNFGGEEREMEITATTKGTFEVAATSTPVPTDG